MLLPLRQQQQCIQQNGGKTSWTAADGCNTCSCDAKGAVQCTQNVCNDYAQCVKKHGSGWFLGNDGCNRCLCMDWYNSGYGGFAESCDSDPCTDAKRQCIQKHGGKLDFPSPNDSCNICNCDVNGNLECTKKNCALEECNKKIAAEGTPGCSCRCESDGRVLCACPVK